MATRAIIRIAEREEGVSFSEQTDKIRVQIYHHYDGYPEGLGVTLANYLGPKKIVNGLPVGAGSVDVANGMGCLTASLIKHLKEAPGNVYIDYPGQVHGDTEYTYYIWGCEDKDIWMSIFETHQYGWPGKNDKCIFIGTPQKLIEKYG
tara:strand:+ start:219 stop:662 length:444 start_codon:yes stop_codon:yes gene_type:complete